MTSNLESWEEVVDSLSERRASEHRKHFPMSFPACQSQTRPLQLIVEQAVVASAPQHGSAARQEQGGASLEGSFT